MENTDKNIQEYKNKLEYLYAKANTISKKKRIIDDLFIFSRMCREDFFVEKIFDWEKDQNLLGISTYDNNILKANILRNKDIYLEISSSVIEDYIKTNFPFYRSYKDSFKEYHKLKEGYMMDIILSFLNDFDNNLCQKFKDKVNEGHLYKINNYEEDSLGHTCEFITLQNNIMFISSNKEDKDTIQDAVTIMHEYGHSIEMDLYHKSGIKNTMQLYPFHEVSSQFIEYAFINYLTENKIYSEDLEKINRRYLTDLFYFIFGINLFSEIDKVGEDEYEYDTEKIKEKEIMIQEKTNYYEMTDYDFEVFDKCFIYGIGYLFSPYLYENYKQNPNEFMKAFQNALLTYPYTNNIDSFKNVGVTSDILKEGKILRKVLKGSK